ncbi:MAG: hypothetical protein QUV20_14130 [Oceanibaculum nanhaiense]|uniref:hypothetical protein n=1 Tax=Oceanibaculum nanhaiense TaxID=1909734 RepID=UPI0025A3B11B|nr:hypothetical protein [Oceanibaculum nanhaiense]MDM7947462.1 hypothetical protein [Oceanibaculum nanhaiense]
MAAAEDIEKGTPGSDQELEQSARTEGLNFDIQLNQPLTQFSRLGTPAYAAESKMGAAGRFYSMVLDPDYPPRTKALRGLRGVRMPGLTWLEEWAVVPWPAANGAQRLICVFRRPNGDPLMDGRYMAPAPMPERQVIVDVVQPVLETLLDLFRQGLTHGAIRPNNLYRCRDQGRVVLGECLSVPPGADQPEIFEPLDRAATEPLTRGEPAMSDDVYALGMTAAFLLVGKHPTPELNAKALLRKRVEGASFMLLSERHRLPYSMLEFLRGTLQDDSRDRWTLMDIDAWLKDGTIPKTKLHLPKMAGWPMEFLGEPHTTLRSLAYTVARSTDIEGAKDFLLSRKFRNWMARGLDEERMLPALDALFGEREEKSIDKMAEAVSLACMQLNPQAPLHYKGLAVNPAGMGTALSSQYDDPAFRARLIEMVKSNIPLRWLGAQSDVDGYIGVHKLLTKAQGLASRSGWGFGVERALYEMQPMARCRSTLLNKYLVYRVEAILPALEEAAAAAKEPFLPVDKHLVAFVMSRRRDFSIGLLEGLDGADEFAKAQAALRFLSFLEEKTENSDGWPELARMLGGMLQPGIDRILRPRRKAELQRKTDKAMAEGKLSALQEVFRQGGLFEQEQREFKDASFRWRLNQTQILSAENDERLLVQRAGELGSRIAFFITVSLSFMSVTGIMVFMLI